MNLVIDIGNTRSKIAIFEGVEIAELIIDKALSQDILEKIITKYPIDRCIISSVIPLDENIIHYLTDRKIFVLIPGIETALPFKNNYTSETLGIDRIAAIAGATCLFPGSDVLIIDAGTAITFDLKNQLEEFLGGNISPGLEMRFKALHEFTAKLPLLSGENSLSFMGTNTREAIINGVQNGIIFEMRGYIDTLIKKYFKLVVILTGGDSTFFENKLKRAIFVNHNLTLIGLNRILDNNVLNHIE